MLFNPLPNPHQRPRPAGPARILLTAAVATSLAVAGLTLVAVTDSDARPVGRKTHTVVVYADGDCRARQDKTQQPWESTGP
ncbi:hypothetical protein [Streptomyces sp. ME18-1-4]|uniref:hypothetical protein n=1 Tax=Streptomyces sp. ME18-1-4 TaxID=3028685 RepID=UPI0029B2DE9F|nr:hypothetical protein [Streptomyces sp. ME18-1-4]MDX3247656.1 hypothetical protein [Streptomyces sp. ME18-1-4]